MRATLLDPTVSLVCFLEILTLFAVVIVPIGAVTNVELDLVYGENTVIAAKLSRLANAEFTAEGPFGRVSQSEFLHTHSLRSQTLTIEYLKRQDSMPFAEQNTVGDEETFDWGSQGAVSTEIHDQGSLGTCAAFAVTGNIEGQRVIHGDGVLAELSVEQIVECSAEADAAEDAANCGVFGGWPKLVLQYVKKRGLAFAKDWPYCAGTLDRRLNPLCYPCMPQGYSRDGCDDHDDDFYCSPETTLGQRKSDGWCKPESSFRASVNIEDFKVLDDTEDEQVLKDHLRNYGPLAVTMSIGPLQLYRRGILNPSNALCPRKGRPGKSLDGITCPFGITDGARGQDHVVLLTGYGVENGKPYWRLKNSWGRKWGEEGYFRLRRGVNSCGIGRFQVATAIGVRLHERANTTERLRTAMS